MSEAPNDASPAPASADAGPSSSTAASAATPVVIGNTVKKAPESGGGTAAGGAGKPKMLFKPSVPIRKKREETVPVIAPPSLDRGRGRGRGGDRGRGARGGRGGGRGGGTAGVKVEDPMGGMVASGPFAQGPSRGAGGGARVIRSGPGPSSLSSVPSTYKLPDDRKATTDDNEEYSDQEAGVQIVDMRDLSALDPMAPRGLPKDTSADVKSKPKKLSKKKSDVPRAKAESDDEGEGSSKPRVKSEPDDDLTLSSDRKKGKGRDDGSIVDLDSSSESTPAPGGINVAQAVDLSESEGEEETQDIRGDFVGWENNPVPPNQLYFFQFPPSFPKFLPIPVAAPAEPSEKVEPMDGVEESSGPTSILKKGVSFAGDKEKERKAKEKAVKKDSKEKDSKEGILSAAKRRKEEERRKLPTGAIGSLLVMKSGKVKMRLGHDMLLDVNAGSKLDFLQHLVQIDPIGASTDKDKHPGHGDLISLAQVDRRFVVTPDVDQLLALALDEQTGVTGRRQGMLKGEKVKREEEEALGAHTVVPMAAVDSDDD